MTDYTKLITALREEGATVAILAVEWNIPALTAKRILEAADAIERLQRERNYLVEQCKGCENCKHAQKSFHEEPCSSCKWKSNFEWRGVK